jgi:magnesium chelatase accessory protein
MRLKPDWDVEGRGWPGRKTSRFVRAAGLDWHVQFAGGGSVVLLIHGTGAATHSWRGLTPFLAKRFKVMSFDLPGHGFTELPRQGQYTLPDMASAIAGLLDAVNVVPSIVVGHSAGAAIAVRMALDGSIAPETIVSINGALMPFPGLAAVAFPTLAKLLFLNPFAAPFLARRANDNGSIARLIRGTGSRLDPRGIDLYARLFRTERHMAATVGMMANWDLLALKRDLPKLRSPLVLVAADRDRAVAPHVAGDVRSIVPRARIVSVQGYGHLAHEEAPAIFDQIIRDAALAPC